LLRESDAVVIKLGRCDRVHRSGRRDVRVLERNISIIPFLISGAAHIRHSKLKRMHEKYKQKKLGSLADVVQKEEGEEEEGSGPRRRRIRR
jgi:hypothetical protein